MTRRKPHLTRQDHIEIIDLYKWGMSVATLAMFYDRHKKYMSGVTRMLGCPARPSHRSPLVSTKRNRPNVEGRIKSSRPPLPSGAAVAADGREEIDQLLRSSARALQAQRIEARQSDVKIHSCPEEVS